MKGAREKLVLQEDGCRMRSAISTIPQSPKLKYRVWSQASVLAAFDYYHDRRCFSVAWAGTPVWGTPRYKKGVLH
jgi:hypothetical protein